MITEISRGTETYLLWIQYLNTKLRAGAIHYLCWKPVRISVPPNYDQTREAGLFNVLSLQKNKKEKVRVSASQMSECDKKCRC